MYARGWSTSRRTTRLAMDGTEATENRLGFDEVAVTPDPLLTKLLRDES